MQKIHCEICDIVILSENIYSLWLHKPDRSHVRFDLCKVCLPRLFEILGEGTKVVFPKK